MSLQAYKTASTRTETPRQAEYRLFGQVTRALMHASTLDKSQFAERMDALDWNRRLWTTLATACSDPANALPPAFRAQIISLSLFVGRHTSEVARGQDDFSTLIDINRMIMQGLSGQTE